MPSRAALLEGLLAAAGQRFELQVCVEGGSGCGRLHGETMAWHVGAERREGQAGGSARCTC